MVVCAPSEYDFGFVHTEKASSFLLYLANPTEVSASWRVRHIPMVPPKISIIAQELEELPKLPLDEPDMFSFDQYSGVQHGPSLPLSDAASNLPLDLNRSQVRSSFLRQCDSLLLGVSRHKEGPPFCDDDDDAKCGFFLLLFHTLSHPSFLPGSRCFC